ncbi:MAG TPA: hypothetical protein VGG28_20005 [Kofleriaceae bacterium]|jgi:hypothetical protein
MRAVVLAIMFAACAPVATPGTTYRANAAGELSDPGARTILVNRAARDLACDASAVVVRAFALPKQSYSGGSNIEYTSIGLAIVEGNGQRITYSVMPSQYNDQTGWVIGDDDIVMVAHIPMIASAPPSPDEAGSN